MDDSNSDAEANAWVAPIAHYLRSHPHASDTAEGIARWWLGAPVTQWSHVGQALASMVRNGQLDCHIAADGREHYRLRHAAAGTPPP